MKNCYFLRKAEGSGPDFFVVGTGIKRISAIDIAARVPQRRQAPSPFLFYVLAFSIVPLQQEFMASKPNPVPGYPPAYDEIPSLTIPPGLEILAAHWFFRHGERTPVRERLTHLGIPSRWNMCSAGRVFAAGVLNDPDLHALPDGKKQDAQLMLLRKRIEYGADNSARKGGENECAWGELTDLGRLSTLRLGKKLRELYVDKCVHV